MRIALLVLTLLLAGKSWSQSSSGSTDHVSTGPILQRSFAIGIGVIDLVLWDTSVDLLTNCLIRDVDCGTGRRLFGIGASVAMWGTLLAYQPRPDDLGARRAGASELNAIVGILGAVPLALAFADWAVHPGVVIAPRGDGVLAATTFRF
jgi:hypothetical protein